MNKNTAKPARPVFTIGHSNRALTEFITLLQAHGVTRIVDVRSMPHSRHNPQFNLETLPAALRVARITYVHRPGLGGLRHARADSPNMAWRNAAFRGFADYMQTAEFAENMAWLGEVAQAEQIAVMCAEALPWRCHRSLIADALVVHGITVEHIMSATQRNPHSLTPWARVAGDRITYPAEAMQGELALRHQRA